MAVKKVTPEEFPKAKADVKSGTKEQFLVHVGEVSTGSEVGIPVIVARGRGNGPNLLITGGQHAEETASMDAVKRFAGQVQPDEISGTLVLVPLINAPGYIHRSRLYPFDAPSVADVGSIRPDAGGVMSARVAYAMAESISLEANFALDIHSTHLDSMNYPRAMTTISGNEPPDIQKQRVDLSYKLGYEVVHLWKTGGGGGGLQGLLHSRGCPRVGAEAGEGWRNLDPFPEIMIRSIRNFCKATGAMKGELEMPDVQIEVDRRFEVTASHGGMSHLHVKPGDFVRAGQVVAEIRNMFDEVVEELITPINGLIIRCSLLPTVATGARVCNVSETPADFGEKWEKRKLPALESRITFAGYNRGK